jgi:hypothetical protein
VVASGAGEFGSNNWSLGSSLDPTIYEGFSINATSGFLNFGSLGFDARISATGPANLQVDLFLNGSSTPYATANLATTGTTSTYTFNFTSVTDASSATSASFRFMAGMLSAVEVNFTWTMSAHFQCPSLRHFSRRS